MILRFIVVSCDQCGEESTPYPTVAETRKAALSEGWYLGKMSGTDCCPRCKRPMKNQCPHPTCAPNTKR